MLILIRYFTVILFFFFFNDTATTEIYTLSLHDALPIFEYGLREATLGDRAQAYGHLLDVVGDRDEDQQEPDQVVTVLRSEEHTSELQSPCNIVCRLLLEKKKTMKHRLSYTYHESSYLI